MFTSAKHAVQGSRASTAAEQPADPKKAHLRRHSFSVPGEPAVPHRELCSMALQRVSIEMQLPVSPTSMIVAMNQLQRRSSREGRANLVRASDPGHVSQHDFGTETVSPWLHGQPALTSLTVSEDAPVIQEEGRPLSFTSPKNSRPSHPWPAQDLSVFDEDEDDADDFLRWPADLPFDLELSNEKDASPSFSGRYVSGPMLRHCVTSTSERHVRRTSQSGDLGDTLQFPNSPCASSSPRLLRRSVTSMKAATRNRRALYHSQSDNSRPLNRQSYIKTDDFRLRRLTDSDAVMNLGYTTCPGEKPLESVAWELGCDWTATLSPAIEKPLGQHHLCHQAAALEISIRL